MVLYMHTYSANAHLVGLRMLLYGHTLPLLSYFCLFVCVEVKLPGQQFFSHVEMEPPLPGYYQYSRGDFHMSRVVRKPVFCICENKDADQLRGNGEADQHLCFHHMDSAIPLLSKSEISSL